MGFYLQPGEPLPAGVRRAVREELDGAIADLSGSSPALHDGIHEARRRFKRIRAVLRLVRAEIGPAYKVENVFFRDAGRALAQARETAALVEAIGKLATCADRPTARALREARRHLAAPRPTNLTADHLAPLPLVLNDLRQAHWRVGGWTLRGGLAGVIASGLRPLYRQARAWQARAAREPTPANHHEWRKQVKYLWCCAGFLRRVLPRFACNYRRRLDELGELLGDDHDLSVLKELLQRDRTVCGPSVTPALLLPLVETRQAELRAVAHRLGRRLFAAKPSALTARCRAELAGRR